MVTLPLLQKMIRDGRRTLIWIAIGYALYIVMILAFYPTIAANSEQYSDLLKSYPDEIISAMYSRDVDDFRFDDPAIYFQTEASIWLFLVLGAFVTLQAFNFTTNAERDHRMDLLMTLPISRQRALATAMANTALLILITLTVVFVSVILFQGFFDPFYIAPAELALAVYFGFWLMMAQASLAYALGASVPSHHHWAGAIALTYFYGTYILMAFAQSIDVIDKASTFFIFKYYDMAVIINEGVNWGDTLVLVMVTLLFTGFAFWRFDNKALGV